MKRKSSRRRKKAGDIVVWALDPVDRNVQRLKPLAKAIGLWRGARGGQVLPVSVISPAELNWPMEISAPITDDLVRITREFLNPAAQKLFSREKVEPKILLQKNPSFRDAAMEVVKYAKKNKAAVIAVSTHGRKGFYRFALGSFAEFVLTHSDIPVLTVNPNAEVPEKLTSIAFPTDFSPHSKRAFKRVVGWAKARGVKLKVLHAFNISAESVPPGYEVLTLAPSVIEQTWWLAKESQKSEGKKWVQAAQRLGVDAEFIFSDKVGPIRERIVEIAMESGADLIAVSTAHGPVAMTFLGGTVRELLVAAKRPVLLVHTK